MLLKLLSWSVFNSLPSVTSPSWHSSHTWPGQRWVRPHRWAPPNRSSDGSSGWLPLQDQMPVQGSCKLQSASPWSRSVNWRDEQHGEKVKRYPGPCSRCNCELGAKSYRPFTLQICWQWRWCRCRTAPRRSVFDRWWPPCTPPRWGRRSLSPPRGRPPPHRCCRGQKRPLWQRRSRQRRRHPESATWSEGVCSREHGRRVSVIFSPQQRLPLVVTLVNAAPSVPPDSWATT